MSSTTTHSYLTSGILEAHLLGLTTEKEREELQQLLETDPEVKDHLRELELTIEDYFVQNSVPPPPAVKNAVLKRINETEIQKWAQPEFDSDPSHESKTSRPANPDYLDVAVSNTHIRVHKNWRTAFIAIFILSKVFLILGLYYYFKAASQEQEIMRLKTEIQQTVPRR